MVWKLLEELHFHAFDVRKQKIGQAAGAQAEPLVVEPFFAKHLFDDSVVDDSVIYGINASGRFETYFIAGFIVIFFNSPAHYISSFRGCSGLLFPGRCLYEICARIHG